MAHRLPADRDHRTVHRCSCSPPTGEPTLLVPDAGAAGRGDAPPGAAALPLVDWTDGERPVRGHRARCCAPTGGYGDLATRAWATAPAGPPEARCPAPSYVLADRRPADAAGGQGRRRARAPGGGRRGRGRDVRARSSGVRFAGRRETDVAADLAGLLRAVRSLAGRLHRRRVGTQRRQPAPRGRRPDHRGRRHGGARLRWPQVRLRLGHHPHRARRRADRRGARGARHRPTGAAGRRSTPSARASRARRSTGRRGR